MEFHIFVFLLLCLTISQVSGGKKRNKFKPTDRDDPATVNSEFEEYKKQSELKFANKQEETEAKEAFMETRRMVKGHKKKGKKYSLEMDRYSHIPGKKLAKSRNGFKKSKTLHTRLNSAPPLNITRHRGAIRRASKGHHKRRVHGKGRRQSSQDLFQQLTDLFQKYGFNTKVFDNVDLEDDSAFKKIFSSDSSSSSTTPRPRSAAPDTLDWREHGYVTPVQDQGLCGSCYSFSANGAIEGQMAACFGDDTELSEQNVINCGQKYGAGGCDGGDPAQVFDYSKANGVATETAYPYANRNNEFDVGTCRFTPTKAAKNSFTVKYDVLPEGDEDALKKALSVGPISACLDAGSAEFQHYSSGVFSGPCTQNVNHAVLIVGYGTDPVEGDYWLVKNSWSEDWGENGYFKIARNAGNMCGIASYALYPTLVGC